MGSCQQLLASAVIAVHRSGHFNQSHQSSFVSEPGLKRSVVAGTHPRAPPAEETCEEMLVGLPAPGAEGRGDARPGPPCLGC